MKALTKVRRIYSTIRTAAAMNIPVLEDPRFPNTHGEENHVRKAIQRQRRRNDLARVSRRKNRT